MTAALTTRAIVLRVVDYGDSDRIVTLLGRTTGRLGALARSARKSHRRFGGGLNMGVVGEATYKQRPGSELATLEGFEVTDPHAHLALDVALTAHAAYALELTEKLAGSQEGDAGVFDLLESMLHLLDTQRPTAERVRVFELALLDRVGLRPRLSSCVGCARNLDAKEATRWLPERGGVACVRCSGVGRSLPPAVRLALCKAQGLPLSEANELVLPKGVNSISREALGDLFAQHIPGPLKSLVFIAKLQGALS